MVQRIKIVFDLYAEGNDFTFSSPELDDFSIFLRQEERDFTALVDLFSSALKVYLLSHDIQAGFIAVELPSGGVRQGVQELKVFY